MAESKIYESPNLLLSSAGSSMESLRLSAETPSFNNGEGSNSNPSTTSNTQEIFPGNQFEILNSIPIQVPGFPQNNIWGRGISRSSMNYMPLYHSYYGSGGGAIANQNCVKNSVYDQRFLAMATDQEESMRLQKLISEDSDLRSKFLNWVILTKIRTIPIIYFLLMHQHGYHVCAKLIDCCQSCDNKQQLDLITRTITSNEELFFDLAIHSTASRIIKKLIKLLKKSSLMTLVLANLCNSFNFLMIDRTGSYVITHCLDTLSANQNTVLCDCAVSNCLQLAMHEYGCISLNNLIDKIQGSYRDDLLRKISLNAVCLAKDPSGNYVVQKVLGLENPIYTGIIADKLRGHYINLSVQKWGSHVVEKCLDSPNMSIAVEDLLSNSTSQILGVAKDQYGNYVIQKALKVTKKAASPLHYRLLTTLQPHIDTPTLKSGYGKNICYLIANGVPC